jgi:hypothetical protein
MRRAPRRRWCARAPEEGQPLALYAALFRRDRKLDGEAGAARSAMIVTFS